MPKTISDMKVFLDALRNGKAPASIAVRFAPVADPLMASQTERVATFVFSDSSVDRYGDTIDARGWVLESFLANPVALFGHDSGSVENVIGRARNVRIDGNRLVGEIEFMEASVNANAEVVYQMVKGGYLNTVSVGFLPIEWAAAKDKSRPLGVDFKKQELLEISIVPIPANPNAVVQAKAAGIDVDRLKLLEAPVVEVAAIKPKIKSLWHVSWLASILGDLDFLEDMVEYEEEIEGDGSDIGQRLTDALKALGGILIDMTVEEVNELLADEDATDDLIDGPIELSARATKMRILQLLTKAKGGVEHAILATLENHIRGRKVTFQVGDGPIELLAKAGKVLSTANEKKLRDAHGAISAACDTIKSVFDAAASDDAASDEQKAALALRQRRAKARRRSTALRLVDAA